MSFIAPNPGEPLFFFDSWGGLHVTLPRDGELPPTAGAFGPSGCSRPATPAEAGFLVEGGETAHTAAQRLGRLVRGVEDGDWDTLSHA